MIDINLIRNNREIVKENIKKKFQDEKLPLVDEVYELDIKYRDVKKTCDDLRYEKNEISKELGTLMREKKFDEAENKKARVKEINTLLDSLEKDEIGLKVTGQLNLNNAKAKEVFDAIKFGSLTGLSVGFSVNEDGYDVKDEDEGFGFVIKNIERLYEISVVPLPADNFARIAECKSLDLDAINDIKDLEMNLRDVGLSRKDAKAFIAKAKSILSSQRDVEEQEEFNNEVNLKLQNILTKLN